MRIDHPKSVAYLVAVLTLIAVCWFVGQQTKKTKRSLLIGTIALFGLFLFTIGLGRHLAGDDSVWQSRRYGPQTWYQEAGAGAVMLLAALVGYLSKDKNA